MKEKFLENQIGYSGKVQSLWGVPVMYFENAFSVKPAELEIIKNLEFDNSDDQNNLVKTSKKKQLFKETIGLADVRDQMNHYACKFIDEIICVDNEFEMTNSWTARTNKEHPRHDHKNTIVSVVYYVKADNATITFYNQHNWLSKAFNFDLSYKQFNVHNSTNLDYNVKTGDIMVFPGYVSHSATNHSDTTKTIIGANYFIRGYVGNDYNTTSLSI